MNQNFHPYGEHDFRNHWITSMNKDIREKKNNELLEMKHNTRSWTK